jgi:hypothetical protein
MKERFEQLLSSVQREKEWRDIKGYEGLYQVSNTGKIKALNYHREGIAKVISQTDNCTGYLKVQLGKDGKKKKYFVHRLVAEAFIPRDVQKDEVNHIDGNTYNNSAENLEWVTHSENLRHGARLGNIIPPSQSKPVAQFSDNGNCIGMYESKADAERKTGIFASNIGVSCRNSKRKAGGFRWMYQADMEATYLMEKDGD